MTATSQAKQAEPLPDTSSQIGKECWVIVFGCIERGTIVGEFDDTLSVSTQSATVNRAFCDVAFTTPEVILLASEYATELIRTAGQILAPVGA